eukprot:scaffold47_cov334-Pavlova_lutheri.AAC.16
MAKTLIRDTEASTEQLCGFQAVHVQVSHQLCGRPHLPEHQFTGPGHGQQRSVLVLPLHGSILFHGKHQDLSDLLGELGQLHLFFVSQVSQHPFQAVEMLAPAMLALVSILQPAQHLGFFVQRVASLAPAPGCVAGAFHGFQQGRTARHFVCFQPHVFQRPFVRHLRLARGGPLPFLSSTRRKLLSIPKGSVLSLSFDGHERNRDPRPPTLLSEFMEERGTSTCLLLSFDVHGSWPGRCATSRFHGRMGNERAGWSPSDRGRQVGKEGKRREGIQESVHGRASARGQVQVPSCSRPGRNATSTRAMEKARNCCDGRHDGGPTRIDGTRVLRPSVRWDPTSTSELPVRWRIPWTCEGTSEGRVKRRWKHAQIRPRRVRVPPRAPHSLKEPRHTRGRRKRSPPRTPGTDRWERHDQQINGEGSFEPPRSNG